MWRPNFLRPRTESQASTSSTAPLDSHPPTPPYRTPVSDDNEEREVAHRVRALSDPSLSRHPSVNMSLNFVGSPGFEAAPAGQARHSAGRRSRTHSLAGSVDQRLSIIEEDHPSPPLPSPTPIHPKTHHRPFHTRFGLGEPPGYSRGSSPPRYAFWDVTGPKGEKFEDLRNNAFVASRGGWKRTCLIAWVIIILIIALAVGLGVGLSSRNTNSTTVPAPAPFASSSPASGAFPAGSHTFTTYLSSISTNCTSNSASWTCQPSVTYSQDSSTSQANFTWIITPTNSTPTNTPNFTIASTNNPFSIDFDDTPLMLVDEGSATERYTFKTTVPKQVFPTASLSIKCFYNETQFSANLYTRKPKSGGAPTSTAASSDPNSFGEWEYAVEATQSIGGGIDVPDCYRMKDGVVEEKLTEGYEEEPAGQFCSCAYKNYGL